MTDIIKKLELASEGIIRPNSEDCGLVVKEIKSLRKKFAEYDANIIIKKNNELEEQRHDG